MTADSLQLPVLLNRKNNARGGVPRAFYITLLVAMGCAAGLALLLKRPHKLRRADGSVVAVNNPRRFQEELKNNLRAFKDWGFLLMLPAFLPAGSFLVYNGSVNGMTVGVEPTKLS